MKTALKIALPAALLLVLGATTPSFAQPAAGGATAVNPENRPARIKGAKAGKGRGERREQIFAPRMVETALGKPFTAQQKEAIDAATDTYNDSVAKALGMTTDELKAKLVAYRQAHKPGAPAAPAAPAAQ